MIILLRRHEDTKKSCNYYICLEIRPPLELIPQPPSLRKRRGLRSVSVSEALLPLSSQERGPGGEF